MYYDVRIILLHYVSASERLTKKDELLDEDKVMEYVESVVGKKAKAEDRRRAFRQAVQDA